LDNDYLLKVLAGQNAIALGGFTDPPLILFVREKNLRSVKVGDKHRK